MQWLAGDSARADFYGMTRFYVGHFPVRYTNPQWEYTKVTWRSGLWQSNYSLLGTIMRVSAVAYKTKWFIGLGGGVTG